MHCRRIFLWSQREGGLAYNYTLSSIKKKWNNLLSEWQPALPLVKMHRRPGHRSA